MQVENMNNDKKLSPSRFKRIEDRLKNAAYWIKNPSKEPGWKDEIFSYPKKIALEKAREGEAWGQRTWTVQPNVDKLEVYIGASQSSSSYLAKFESRAELDKWLKNTIVAEKYDMTIEF